MNQIHLTPVVRNLLILNIAVFVISEFIFPSLNHLLPLFEPNTPWYTNGSTAFKPFQVVTYMFMHGGLWHLGMNMYFLVSFGPLLEMVFKERRFLEIFLFSGIFSGIILALFDPTRVPAETSFGYTEVRVHVVGASGALSGLLAAFGWVFPKNKMGLLFIPIQFTAREFAIGVAVISAVLVLVSFRVPEFGGGISHFGHLAGMVGGFLYYDLRNKVVNLFRRK